MEKLFIPYEQALAFKKLGFDEPCLACYYKDKTFAYHPDSDAFVDAQLYQQAFKFLVSKITNPLYVEDFLIAHLSEYKSREEAELACLKELIEIVTLKK